MSRRTTRRSEAKRSNARGTCLWCGLKLRAYRWRMMSWWTGPRDARGDYGDGYFCGQNCGRLFGVAAAIHGFRLKPEVDGGTQ